MKNEYYIQSYCHLKNGRAILSGERINIEDPGSLNEFLKSIYQYLQIDYPKFFKMDEVCKLAFIATELALKDFPLQEISEGETGIVLANSSSTLETDRKHQESIREEQNYFPSPAVFVYTLPNITIGEITIRHKLKGENTFFISEKYDTAFLSKYVNLLLQNNKANKVLTGWVEYGSEGYDGFIYLAGKDKKGLSLEHHKENIDRLYNSLPSV